MLDFNFSRLVNTNCIFDVFWVTLLKTIIMFLKIILKLLSFQQKYLAPQHHIFETYSQFLFLILKISKFTEQEENIQIKYLRTSQSVYFLISTILFQILRFAWNILETQGCTSEVERRCIFEIQQNQHWLIKEINEKMLDFEGLHFLHLR